jgi:ribonuclease HI
MVVSVFSDGGVIDSNPSQIGCTWAFCTVDDKGNRVEMFSGVLTPGFLGLDGATNNVAELWALTEAVLTLPLDFHGEVCSDSLISIQRVFHVWLHQSTKRLLPVKDGVKMNGVPPVLMAQCENAWAHLAAIRKTGGCVKPVLLQGHPTKADLKRGIGAKRGFRVSIHNVDCDTECGRVGAEFVKALRA